MWIKAKDLQDMLDSAKRAGFTEGEIQGRADGRRMGNPFSTRRSERDLNRDLNRLAMMGHVERRLVNVSFEYKGTRTTFRISDTVRELDVTKNDGRLLVKVCKFDNSIVNYDYELSRINSEIRKEYK